MPFFIFNGKYFLITIIHVKNMPYFHILRWKSNKFYFFFYSVKCLHNQDANPPLNTTEMSLIPPAAWPWMHEQLSGVNVRYGGAENEHAC